MHFEEKPPNHERWIISYADFTTLLLATFVVMYAVSSINSSKFQEMAEAFSTAFIGRTVTLDSTGLAAENKSPFDFMPSPVHVPIITREPQIKNLPPALRQEEPKRQAAGAEEEAKTKPMVLKRGQIRAPMPVLRDLLVREPAERNPAERNPAEHTTENLDAAYEKLTKALAALIGKGEVQVSLQSLGVVIDINEVLLFHNGKAELVTAALPLVDNIAGILKGLPYQIQVNGFTDNVPIHNAQFDSNWDLSATRAISVVKRFVAAGINPALVVGAGFGEFHPVAPNNTPEGKAANRRVSIVVVSPLQDENDLRTHLFGGEQRSETPNAPPGKPSVPALAAPIRPAPASAAPVHAAPARAAPARATKPAP
ncbi:MAG TPA: flagellar motor protein MotB [Stellaceae bacterium]|jgi:chemotaxis protein MotB|nr:flagellar motor protein MotB [Stellaceae bacterium]